MHAVFRLQDMHKQTMQGKFMLQLDEAVNIAAGIKDRYREPAHNRCLKLHLTDDHCAERRTCEDFAGTNALHAFNRMAAQLPLPQQTIAAAVNNLASDSDGWDRCVLDILAAGKPAARAQQGPAAAAAPVITLLDDDDNRGLEQQMELMD
ncbi:hypothetical protein OEZ86_013538 [Tetradesmus obliquus]|nr:hypothetical protein OEZ86_013538 [Tetradesmus obliquus]